MHRFLTSSWGRSTNGTVALIAATVTGCSVFAIGVRDCSSSILLTVIDQLSLSFSFTPDFFQFERESPLHHHDSIA